MGLAIALSFNIRPDEAIVSRTISMIPPNRREELIIRQARERLAVERAAFLDGACAGDEALRQRLEARLAAHDQPETLLASQADTAQPTIELDLADAPDEAVGQTVARYKLLERIDEGGCGWFCAYWYTRGIFSFLVAALSLGLPLAGATPELPSTPAGKVLAGYLEALNSGNKDKLEPFIKAHRPDRPDALDRMLDLRWNTGGFDLHSIESSQALNIQAVLHEREGNGNYNRMSVTVSDGDG